MSFAWDLGVIFLGVPNCAICGLLKTIFFYFGLKGVMEKCVGCFLVYLFLRGFLTKRCNKVSMCLVAVKNALLPFFNVF